MSRIRHNRSLRNDRDNRPDEALPPEEKDELLEDAELEGYDDSDDLDSDDDDDTTIDESAGESSDWRGAAEGPASEDEYSERAGRRPRALPPPDGRDPAPDPGQGTGPGAAAGAPPQPLPAAALLCPRVLARMLEKFEQIAAGETPDRPERGRLLVRRLRLSAHPDHRSARARTCRRSARCSTRRARMFAAGVRDEFPGSASAWRRDRFRRLAKCRKLALELSPRTELLERWTDELTDLADELKHLAIAPRGRRLPGRPRPAARRCSARP